MQPDHQCAAGPQSLDYSLHDFLLFGGQKIGEHRVATEDEIERPSGMLSGCPVARNPRPHGPFRLTAGETQLSGSLRRQVPSRQDAK